MNCEKSIVKLANKCLILVSVFKAHRLSIQGSDYSKKIDKEFIYMLENTINKEFT